MTGERETRIQLCGRLSVEVAGREVQGELRGGQGKLLFVYLVFHRGRPVFRPELIDALWGDSPPAEADALLRTHLSRLRRALEPAELGGKPDVSLVLPENARIDVDEAEVWVGAADAALAASDWQQAAEAARRAAAIARQELLPGLEAPWLDDRRAQLTELCTRALESAAAAGLELGGAELGEAARDARELIERAPYRESGHRLLMEALARLGNVAEALKVYDELRVLLREELGAVPEPEVQRLHKQLLTEGCSSGAILSRAHAGTGVVLSSELEEGGERAGELHGPHMRILRSAVGASGGRRVENTARGFVFRFDSPSDAVECSVAVQRAAERRNRGLPGASLRPRIGLHADPDSGAAESGGGERGNADTAAGARALSRVAQGGQILVSERVTRLLGKGAHDFAELDDSGLGAVAQPGVSEVLWEPSCESSRRLPRALSVSQAAGFVGRERELAQLRKRWNEALSGERRIVMVGGAAGIGKTRLAGQLALEVQEAGGTVLYGRCHEESFNAYEPFAEALRQHVALSPGDELTAWVTSGAPELGRLVPELGRSMLHVSASAEPDPEGERYRLFEAVTGLLVGASEVSPVLLLMDDLHWADEATLLLLKHLVRSPEESPLMILCTYSHTELRRSHPLAETLGDLRAERSIERVSLGGLTEEAVRGLVVERAGDGIPADLTHALWEETEGNPFFAQEILRHLLDSDALEQGEGRYSFDLAIARAGIPESVQEVLGKRLSRLAESTNQVLAIASVIGREFDFRVLERVSELRREDLLAALEEAAGAGFVVDVQGGGLRYGFAHGLIRKVLGAEIPTTARLALHLRIGMALEVLHASRIEAHLPELALHFLESAVIGDSEKAIEYARRAALQASGQLAYERAATHYQNALAIDELSAGPEEAQRCELLLSLGEAQWKAGHAERAGSTLSSATELSRDIQAHDLFGRAALGYALGKLRGLQFAHVADDHVICLLEEALTRVAPADSALRVRLLAALALALHATPEVGRRAALGREAVETARRLGDPALELFALHSFNWAMVGPDGLEERRREVEHLLGLAAEVGDRDMSFWGHHFRFATLLELGETRGAEAAVEDCARLAEELRQPLYDWQTTWFQATLAMMEGRLDDLDRLSNEAFELGRSAEPETAVVMWTAQRFSLSWARGRLDGAEPGLRLLVEHYPERAVWHALLAFLYSEQARETEAREQLELAAARGFDSVARDGAWLVTQTLWSLVCGYLKDASSAKALYEQLLPYAERTVVPMGAPITLGSVETYLGVLASTMHRRDDAVRHFEAALRRNQQIGDLPRVALTLIEHARLLVPVEHGDGAHRSADARRARDLAERALAICEDRQMAGLASKAKALDGAARRAAPAARPG